MSKTVWLSALLVFSIGLNLVFVGVVIGRHVFGMPPGRPHLEWMMQEVSDDTRKKVRSSMRDHMRAVRPDRRNLREAQGKLHESITAEDYDESRVIERFAEVRQATGVLQTSMHEQIVKNLREYKPEERMQVLRMMTRHERRDHRKPAPPEG
ncbi:MAG: periplasmic heavy metal sensor [Gammaproteobacteria bacterium]|jgi:uncharacterized membrane protein|nr:periplasmic heavy metal sensor [Gammaproteobacteria bacterium]MBT4492348.1 periplasmic heavy metal sensor [Gammaproteobacteria bacterium]MBT7371985.1 periplasmic heavy metal sensor [Gammaproteobacteria bacterium]